MDNFKRTISCSYKNSLKLFQDNKIQLILEKIKLEEKPEYKKFLHSYFNDPSKYFVKKFKDNPVIVGKKYNKNTSFQIKFDVRTSPKRKLKKNFVNKTIVEHKKNSSSDKSSEEKNNNGDLQKDNNLKPGQRYVDDLEINEIFTNFKNTQKANKNKITNNIKINDIRKFRAENMEKSKTIKSRLLMRKKTIKLLKGLSPFDLNNNDSKNINNIKTVTEGNISNNGSINNSIKKTSNKKLLDSINKKDSDDSFPNINSNKTISNNNNNLFKVYKNNANNLTDKNSIFFFNESSTPKSNRKIIVDKRNMSKTMKMNENPINTYYNFNKLYQTLNENNKIDIIKKQIQYLSTEKKIYKKELANKLASQEKTFINNINSRNKMKQISLYMSNKLKIPNEKLLMNRTEYFRINKDLKSRLSKQMEFEYIEGVFNWEKDLKNFDPKNKYEEIIRDPKFKIKNYPNDAFYSLNNEYLAKRLSKKHLKKFVNTNDNIKYNINGLFIQGKNLLELEQEINKGIKGKKILNNYEEVLPYSSLKEDIYANHFHI